MLAVEVTMSPRIQAIYENGVLKPLQKLALPDQQRVEIFVLADDIPSSLIAEIAEQAGSYNFLNHSDEDIYTIEDGEGLD